MISVTLTQGQNQSGSGGPGGDKKGDKVITI